MESEEARPLRADEKKAIAMTVAGAFLLAGAAAVYWIDRTNKGCNGLVFFLISVGALLIQQIGLDRGFEAIAKPIAAWRGRTGNGSPPANPQ